MSESLQFGHHPDADQISAFVEHALPTHEREQVLGHLAVCPECRTIVALSLPEVEEPAQPPIKATRKPWWAGWAVAWPVAGALAAATLLVVYTLHVKIFPKDSEQQGAVARLAEPTATQDVQPPSAKSGIPKPQTPPPASPARREGMAAAAPRLQSQPLTESQSIGGPLLMKGREIDTLQPLSNPPPALALKKTRPALEFAPATGRDSSSGFADRFASAPSRAVGGPQREMAKIPPTVTLSGSAPTATAAAPMPAGAATTVTVESAPLQIASSDAANVEVSQADATVAQLRHPLPSHLPVLSMATQGKLILAIDTSREVFMSKDAGKRWKAIHPPWQGRAVKASLVEFEERDGAAAGGVSVLNTGTSTANGGVAARSLSGAFTANSPLPPGVKGSSLSGTVSDMTGAEIPGASVTVIETATGVGRTVRTDGSGRYLIDGLAPGNYRVQAASAGFRKQEIENVAVTASGPAVANLSLPIGAATQTVSVAAESVAIPADKKVKTASEMPNQHAPVFEIVTDSGERWTSIDGKTWKRM